jgi:oligopeptidase B
MSGLDTQVTAPVAKRVRVERTIHGETMGDDYAWLRDRDDPDTIRYLEAENAHTQAAMAPTADLQAQLFEEIKSRIQETDLTVPVRKGGWWYYTRTVEGKQYPVHCRRRSYEDDGTEQVLLDSNELAGSSDYFSLGIFDVSPDHRWLAYSTDFDGDEVHTVRFRDLETGADLADTIPNTSYGSAWAADNATLFYTTLDHAKRPHRVWRHRLGTTASDDVIVLEEPDERFFAGVQTTRSEAFVVIDLQSKITSEAHVIDAAAPTEPPRVVAPRRQGVEYRVEHHGDRFYVLTNDEAENFRLMAAPVDAPGRDHWAEVIAHDPAVRLEDVDAFAHHLLVSFRRDGLTGLRVIDLDAGDTHDVTFAEPVYTVGPGHNPEFDTDTIRFGYTSLVTPASTYDYDLRTRERSLLKQVPVLGGYDPDDYESEREWAVADDGARVPISLVRRKGTPTDGSAPCLLYGYGSYEITIDPWFSHARLSLLDRGFVFAIAHIRGGGEMGRHWYEDGKLLAKRNTFTDFIACARHLVDRGDTSPDRLVARGGSAGGLLMGAVANMAPELFAAIVAEVPFVDVVTTMLDPSLPLTVIEWEEWGNPEVESEYRAMREYSPYDNVAAHGYPAILVTAGLNDPRVSYHEPAKWVAKLRATKTDDRPLLLKTELGAGHGGPSGRYDAWRDEAFILAFVLTSVA